jgi:hypothetical protein
MSHVDEEPVELNTESVVLPTHLSSNMLPTTSDNAEHRTTHEFPEMRTDDESRPQDDQELRDGINEQMNLFWGAVSSAFAEPVEQEEHQQQQDEVPRHEGDGGEIMNVEQQGHDLDGEAPAENGAHEEPHQTMNEPNQDAYLPEPTQDEPSETHAHQDQDQDHLTNATNLAPQSVEHADSEHPRNEWEHVQLLMSLGGQLGQDLAALGDGQAGSGGLGLQGGIGYPEGEVEIDGGHAGQLDDPVVSPHSHSHDHDVGNGETPNRPRTRRIIALEEMATVNAEAGPSRLPATVQDSTADPLRNLVKELLDHLPLLPLPTLQPMRPANPNRAVQELPESPARTLQPTPTRTPLRLVRSSLKPNVAPTTSLPKNVGGTLFVSGMQSWARWSI